MFQKKNKQLKFKKKKPYIGQTKIYEKYKKKN